MSVHAPLIAAAMLQTKTDVTTGLRSPGDGGQSPSGHGRSHNGSEFSDIVPIKRGQHYYELHKTTFEQKSPPRQQNCPKFRSNSEEELDKLLAGLDKLTETLPDLSSVRSYSVLSGIEKPPTNGNPKPDLVRSPDLQLSLIKPSVIAKQSSGLQSRDTYDSARNDFSTTMMSTAALSTSQPYHTRSDSKPFSYIRTSGPNSRNPSRNISRASSREVLGQPGLESPGLLRKIMGVSGPATESDSGSRPISPAITSSR